MKVGSVLKIRTQEGRKKNLSFGATNFQVSRPKVPKFSDSKPAYLTYTEVNSHVWKGPVNIGFTGPGRALDAPEGGQKFRKLAQVFCARSLVEHNKKWYLPQKVYKAFSSFHS
jgi:hypothetical protein